MIEVVAFDGDDTLWHSESLFAVTEERLADLLDDYVSREDLAARLLVTEQRNLGLFGYGVKGFTLSMIETAIEVSGACISAHDIATIVDWGKTMLGHPVELLEGVAEVLDDLCRRYRLALVTKGDLFHQESKLAGSGLGDLFSRVEIVSEKNPATYQRVLDALQVGPARFLMVGNSVRSDITPVVELGARAAHIPYHVTWAHEHAPPPSATATAGGWWELADIRELPELLARLEA